MTNVSDYTYRVLRPPEDGWVVAACVEFSSLWWPAASPPEALAGIAAVAADVLADLDGDGE